jgi:subtilisin family serine protease
MGSTLTPTHDRILQDILACRANGQGAIGFGLVYHPTNFDQVSYFSSRGPSADGRVTVGAVTAGENDFAQAASGGLYFVSGTSFAAPTGAGAAALLIAATPRASAKEIRNALIRGANDDLLSEHSTPFDRGGGYLDLV